MAPESLVSRLFLAGPLLYVGLAMWLDPSGFAAVLGRLSAGLSAFRQRLGDQRWPLSFQAPDDAPATGRDLTLIRLVGLAFTGFAVFAIVECGAGR